MRVDRAEIERRLTERNGEDRREAWMLIALGLPLALAALGVMTALMTLVVVLVFSPESLLLPSLIVLVGVAGAMAFDAWRHPSEDWSKACGLVRDLEKQGRLLPMGTFLRYGGPLAMANPVTWGARVLVPGCVNVVLGGPRNVRKGVDKLLLVRGRSACVVETLEFTGWLANRGAVPEGKLEGELAEHPRLRAGRVVAADLDLLVWKPGEEGKEVSLREF